jgi:hypothetical protein
MADFCQECAIEMFGKDTGDMAGLCGDGEMAQVLCETCGYIWVNKNGKRLGFVKDDLDEIIIEE